MMKVFPMTQWRDGEFLAWNWLSGSDVLQIEVLAGATQGCGARFSKNDAQWGAERSGGGSSGGCRSWFMNILSRFAHGK